MRQAAQGKTLTKKLSVIVVSYNMARELPRTIRSLSPAMQRDIASDDYEVIVIDNGSTRPFDEAECRRWIPDLTVTHASNPTPSPVAAVNTAIAMARAELIGVFIDGARIASPGMLAGALVAAKLHERPVIGTLAFHLGPEVQMESVRKGYDQQTEDALLAACRWEDDAYRLFDISVLAASSAAGWFVPPAETNALFLKAGHWAELRGYEASFASAGGGYCNLDMWARACEDTRSQVFMLLGEATFHQVHGGIATNALISPDPLFAEEYERIRGKVFAPPTCAPIFIGTLSPPAYRWIEHSAALAKARRGPHSG
jgi:hypothetical protein